jgi:hypothetical protein
MVKTSPASSIKCMAWIGALTLVTAITHPASSQSDEENFQALQYRALDAVKDAKTGWTLELGTWEWHDETGVWLTLVNELKQPKTSPFHDAAISLRSLEPSLTKIEYDGQCYFVRARFDSKKDRLTSYFMSDSKELCLYVRTPEGKAIGYQGKPKTLGEALEARVFAENLLQELGRAELIGKDINDANRLLARYGFHSEISQRTNRATQIWHETPSDSPIYGSYWVELDVMTADGIVTNVAVHAFRHVVQGKLTGAFP